MVETFLVLLAGHLLGDFVFQPNALVRHKKRLPVMLLHVAIVAAVTALLLGARSPEAVKILAVVVGTHFAMDVIKAHWLGDYLWSFLLDQIVHLAVIVGLAISWPNAARDGIWGGLPAATQSDYYAGLVLLSGFIIAIPVAAIVIRKLIEPISPSSSKTITEPPTDYIEGMKNAGKYIGWLERALILVFILSKQPDGVGFLLAAKSILRFREVEKSPDRHQAEYIIIGTLLSFLWALVVATIVRAAISHWVT